MEYRENLGSVGLQIIERLTLSARKLEEYSRQLLALLTIDKKTFIHHEVLEKINGIPKEYRTYSITPHFGGNYVIVFFDTDTRTFFSTEVPVITDTTLSFSDLPINRGFPLTQDAERTAGDGNY